MSNSAKTVKCAECKLYLADKGTCSLTGRQVKAESERKCKLHAKK